jgi:hypothetical protein
VTDEEHDAIERLRPLRDPASDPLFWEALLARRLDAKRTAPRAPYDLDLGSRTVEVKFSSEIRLRFRGGPRQVFRWAGIRPAADATVLIGLDAQRSVYAWVLPRAALRGTRSITTVVPRARRGGNPSPLRGYAAPTEDLLGAVLIAARDSDLPILETA